MSELVFQTQDTFRALMDATARPGTIRMLQGAHAPPPLMPATAAVISSLADYETPLWLDAGFSDAPAVLDWIRFTAGAHIVEDPREAAFALISSARVLPDFGVFAQGSEEYPGPTVQRRGHLAVRAGGQGHRRPRRRELAR